ncbi:MAG TPA: Ig-like domain-containing protein [Clostridia bacterium]|nr:Ig-like domain-containing protein [Clostridia bacterium]
MKRVRKILCLVIAITFAATMLIGCSQDEMNFLGAAMKSADITSMSSKTELTLNIDAQGLEAEDQESLDQITSIINGSPITIDQKTKSNKDNTVSTSQTNVGFTVMGFGIPVTLWTDYDLTSATPKMKTIIKVPEALSMVVSSSSSTKPYLVMDLNKMLAEEDKSSADSLKKLTPFSTTFSSKIKDFIMDYALQYNPGFPVITGKGKSTVNGQDVSLYNLKLDDTSLKNLLAYTVPNFAKNDKAMSFLKDLIYSIADITGGSDGASLKKDFNEAYSDFKKDPAKAQANWNKEMNVLKDVKMLGSKGINIDFGVNSDGYIVSAKGTVDVIFDLKALDEASEKINAIEDSSYKPKATTTKGKIEINADFNTTVSDINKDIQISLPKLTAQNSSSLEDMLGSSIDKVTSKTPSKPAVKRDTTPPSQPVVNKVTRTSKTITGKAEAGSTIIVKNGKTVIGKGIANAKGVFSITIKPLKAKATLTVTATDKAGNVSKAATVIVK